MNINEVLYFLEFRIACHDGGLSIQGRRKGKAIGKGRIGLLLGGAGTVGSLGSPPEKCHGCQ